PIPHQLPLRSSLPTRRSSDLQLQSATADYERNSHKHLRRNELQVAEVDPAAIRLAINHMPRPGAACGLSRDELLQDRLLQPGVRDRKSTRLNSSHVSISYAVF